MAASATTAIALRYFDTKDYGAKSDLKRGDNATTTGGNATIAGTTFSGTATDAGKLIRVQAAGTQLFNNTDGAMSNAVVATKNRFTSAGSSFTQAVVGRWIIITGQFTARIIGVESATQLRLATPAGSVFSGATWTINEDHYTTIATSVAGTSVTLTVAPIRSVTSAIVWYGTDDATAIQAAVTDAEQTSNLGGAGNTVYHKGASAIGSPIYLQKATQFIGSGYRGYSALLGLGTTRLMLLAPKIRGIVAGGSDTGMGVNGSMTSGSAVLTDPEANFLVGDVGKNIIVYGAGTQTGSSIGFFLNTTILSRSSATSVTLNANAGTTVTGAIYSYSSTAGYNGGLGGPSVKNVHIMGGPGQRAGLHLMNVSESIIEEVACSEFTSGVAQFLDPGPSVGFTNQSEFRSCYAIDSRIGFKHDRGSVIFTGNCFVDGNSNRVDCNIPEGMTLGVETDDAALGGYFKMQAIGTGIRCHGRGAPGSVIGGTWGFENISVAFDLASDGSNGGRANVIGFDSMGNSNAGGGFGLRLRAGAAAKLTRGFHLDSDIDMFSLVDPAATLSVIGESIQKAGPINDGDFFNTPYDGATGRDITNNRYQIRMGGNWRLIATTGIISRVKRHAQVSNAGSATTLLLGITSTVPVGHTMVIPIVHGSTTQTTTVTDSKGNSYNTDSIADLATGQTPHAAIATGKVTTPLVNGDTITVTVASAVNVLTGEAYEYTGMASSSWLDQHVGATGTGTAVDSGPVTTTAASELLLGVVCNASAGAVATETPGAGWTAVSDFTFASGIKRFSFLEQTVTSTGTFNATETLGSSNDWAAVIATYKAA